MEALTTDKGQGYSSEQIQAAKEFIWNHLEDATRVYIIYLCELNEIDRKKLYTHKMLCYLSADRNGEVVGKEIAILSLP